MYSLLILLNFLMQQEKKVKYTKVEGELLDISNLTSGVYYLEINLKNKIKLVEKLVKKQLC